MQLPLHIKIIDNVKKITGEIDCAKHCNGINDPACYIQSTKECFLIPLVSLCSISHYCCFSLDVTLCCFLVGKKLIAYYESQDGTIRHISCLWLCDSHQITNKCHHCNQYHWHNINGALSMATKKLDLVSPGRSSSHSHTNY